MPSALPERWRKTTEDRDGNCMNMERTYSLRELYEEHMPSVYRAAFHCVQNHSRAETIVRDSFLDLAGSRLRFWNKRQIRGFLILAAVKRCKEWHDCDPKGRERQESVAMAYLREQEGYTAWEMAALMHIWRSGCMGK